jgi:hypothetical protein
MTLTLELSPEQKARVEAEAQRIGSTPPDVLEDLIDEHLPPANLSERDATLALFEQWRKEDENMTEEEIEQEEQFWVDFRESLNETRRACGMREI